jgi:hypothetical protein
MRVSALSPAICETNQACGGMLTAIKSPSCSVCREHPNKIIMNPNKITRRHKENGGHKVNILTPSFILSVPFCTLCLCVNKFDIIFIFPESKDYIITELLSNNGGYGYLIDYYLQ